MTALNSPHDHFEHKSYVESVTLANSVTVPSIASSDSSAATAALYLSSATSRGASPRPMA